MDATSQRSKLVEINGILSTTKFTFNCPPVTFSSSKVNIKVNNLIDRAK